MSALVSRAAALERKEFSGFTQPVGRAEPRGVGNQDGDRRRSSLAAWEEW